MRRRYSSQLDTSARVVSRQQSVKHRTWVACSDTRAHEVVPEPRAGERTVGALGDRLPTLRSARQGNFTRVRYRVTGTLDLFRGQLASIFSGAQDGAARAAHDDLCELASSLARLLLVQLAVVLQ